MKIGFYLKFNTDKEYSYRILQKWLDVTAFFDSDVYILCDHDEIIKKIKENCALSGNEIYLNSIRNGVIKEIASTECAPRWENTACAMLTPFWHMKQYDYDYVWNIDADDTLILLSAYRTSVLIGFAADYAQKNDLDVFSLDMWFSRRHGKEWTFGVTYIKSNLNWFDIFKKFSINETSDYKANIDMYFTKLIGNDYISAGSFYSNNLRFIHYTDDFFANTETSGFYHWLNGRLLIPIDYYCLGMRDSGEVSIHKDVVDIDISVSDGESLDQMKRWSRSRTYSARIILGRGAIEDQICQNKVKRYLKRMGSPKSVVAFGAGPRFSYALQFLKDLPEFTSVCDNSEALWGKEINGVKVISPNEIIQMKSVLVLITIMNPNSVSEVYDQLHKMGLPFVDIVDNYLRCFD